MRSRTPAAVAALVAASFLFGATFVVVKGALADIGPISFVAWRFLIGAVVLALFALPKGRGIWVDGTIAGIALFAGYALQTGGLVLTNATNSALITGLYVVLTPLVVSALARRLPSPWVMGAAVVAFVGLYLITDPDGLRLGTGDLLTLGCALAFSIYITLISAYAPRHPVVPFTTVQLAVTAVLAFPLAWLTEDLALPPSSVWVALAITGLGVSVGAYLLQVWAQTILDASISAVVLAAEPAFAVATAWVVLGERLDLAGWIGALLILAAIVVAVTRQTDPAAAEAEAVAAAH